MWKTAFKNFEGTWSMSRPFLFKFFKGCLLQILLGQFLNTLTHLTLLGDLNEESKEPYMQSFLEMYGLRTWLRNQLVTKIQKTSSIDLILINWSSFQCSCVMESDLSDFYQMTVTIMITTFQKLKPKITYYGNYKMYSNGKF